MTYPCTAVEETENIPHEIKWSQNNHFCYKKFIFSCSPTEFGMAFLAQRAPGRSPVLLLTKMTLSIRRAWLVQALAIERAQGKERRNTGKADQQHWALRHALRNDWAIALLLSADTSSRSALMHLLKTDTACILQSQHDFKSRLPIIGSNFVYYCRASGQTKKEPHCAQRCTKMLN